jgi:hypothetical protein
LSEQVSSLIKRWVWSRELNREIPKSGIQYQRFSIMMAKPEQIYDPVNCATLKTEPQSNYKQQHFC